MAPKGLVDTHAHLNLGHFDKDRHDVIIRAKEAGIEWLVNIGIDLVSCRHTLELVQSYPGFILGTVGIHPHAAAEVDSGTLRELEEMAAEDGIVALGEMGLDYYRDRSPRDIQARVFRAQLRLAKKLGLPAVIHSRSAEDDTFKILQEEGIEDIGGVMHCYSGSLNLAEKYVDMGLYVSFTGVITFPAARKAREIAEKLPLERILLETDCPFMAPVPYRGKRNEPAYVRYVAEKLAEVKRLPLEEVIEVTHTSSKNLFNALRQGKT